MKRTQILGTITFYFLIILSFYAVVKMQMSYVDENSPTKPVTDDSMKFISSCRQRIATDSANAKKSWSSPYKNPCFYKNEKLYCLPYFLVIGFPKCGTTDLFQRMKHHPEFVPPKMKELHWLSRYRFLPFFRQNTTVNYERYSPKHVYGLHLYAQMFADLAEKLESSHEMSSTITADFSPSTIWDNDLYTYMSTLAEIPPYYTQNFIKTLNPCAKLIVMMRDPAERLYSDYLFMDGNQTAKDFQIKVKQAVQIYKNCMKFRSVHSCLYDSNIAKKSKIRLRIGPYSVYIQEWLKVFPRDQMHFVRMEDYVSNMDKVLTEIFDFLDMERPSPGDMERMLQEQPVNTRSSRGKTFEPMFNKTYHILSRFYAPFNNVLSILLNNSDYRWHYR